MKVKAPSLSGLVYSVFSRSADDCTLTGGGTLQTGRCCPLKTTEHPGTCCALQAGMCWPVQSGIPWGATVVTV